MALIQSTFLNQIEHWEWQMYIVNWKVCCLHLHCNVSVPRKCQNKHITLHRMNTYTAVIWVRLALKLYIDLVCWEYCALWYILIIKANMMHYFSTSFRKELNMFRTDSVSIIRSLNTVFTAIGICHTTYVATWLVWQIPIALNTVLIKTPDDGH